MIIYLNSCLKSLMPHHKFVFAIWSLTSLVLMLKTQLLSFSTLFPTPCMEDYTYKFYVNFSCYEEARVIYLIPPNAWSTLNASAKWAVWKQAFYFRTIFKRCVWRSGVWGKRSPFYHSSGLFLLTLFVFFVRFYTGATVRYILCIHLTLHYWLYWWLH